MKQEGAIAPVIGVLLILTIIVSAIALLNATYIPNLKQQSEIEHLASVEKAFLDLSSDIERMIAFGDCATVRRHIQLGGGEAPFSGLRSSGTLRINESVAWLIKVDGTWISYPTLVTISYQPIGNFWQNQGYVWEAGVVNITKGSRTTWLTYEKETDAQQRMNEFLNATTGIPVPTGSGDTLNYINISRIHSMNTGTNTFSSSNGIGTITLSGDIPIPRTYSQVEILGLHIPPESHINRTVREKYESILNPIGSLYSNCVYSDGPVEGREGLFLNFTYPIPVTITEKPLAISVL